MTHPHPASVLGDRLRRARALALVRHVRAAAVEGPVLVLGDEAPLLVEALGDPSIVTVVGADHVLDQLPQTVRRVAHDDPTTLPAGVTGFGTVVAVDPLCSPAELLRAARLAVLAYTSAAAVPHVDGSCAVERADLGASRLLALGAAGGGPLRPFADDTAELHQLLADAEHAVSALLDDRRRDTAALHRLDDRVRELTTAGDALVTAEQSAARAEELALEVSTLQAQVDSLHLVIHEIHRSNSWRVTKPLRTVGGLAREYALDNVNKLRRS